MKAPHSQQEHVAQDGAGEGRIKPRKAWEDGPPGNAVSVEQEGEKITDRQLMSGTL